jgi:hypothetical protein
MHVYRPQLLELEERALPNVLADPLGVAGLDTLLAVGEVRHLARLVGDAVLPVSRLAEQLMHSPPTGPHTPHHLPAGVHPLMANGNPGGIPPGDPGGLPVYKVHPVAQFDASSWPEVNYPAVDLSPPPGTWGNPPYWSDPNWNSVTNAFEWNPTFTGVAGFKVCPPSGMSPSYTVGPVIDYWAQYTAPDDVAGNWSSQGVRLQIWRAGVYAVEVDFLDGSSYLGTVSVHGGTDGPASGAMAAWTLPQASKGALVIAQPMIDVGGFCESSAKYLPNAKRAGDVTTAVCDLQSSFADDNGRNPIDAILIGHGGVSCFQFSSDWMGTQVAAQLAVEQTFANGLRGEIKSLLMFSCHTGETSPGCVPFIEQLAKDLHDPNGCPVTVSAFTGVPEVCDASPHFAAPTNGKLVSFTAS